MVNSAFYFSEPHGLDERLFMGLLNIMLFTLFERLFIQITYLLYPMVTIKNLIQQHFSENTQYYLWLSIISI